MFKLFFFLFVSLLSFDVLADKDDHQSTLTINAGEKTLKFSGYFDTYYAYDFSHPVDGNKDFSLGGGRDYTSNPVYDQQFSIDYGFLQTDFEVEEVAFRFAYHFGDIVEKMYEFEPDRLKVIREASGRYRLTPKLVMEAGYMPSIFGFETFINKDNMHATRAYMTDFAPDFDAGVRFYYEIDKQNHLKFQVTNGWQIERDTNKDKSLGFAYVFEEKNKFMFNWGKFFGNEAPSSDKHTYRYYNNIFAKIWLGNRFILAPMLDVGWQEKYRPDSRKYWAPWQSYGLSLRYALSEKDGIAIRYDHTYDPSNIIPELMTHTIHGWNAHGATMTYERLMSQALTYRLEARYVKSQDAVFQTKIRGHFQREESFLYSSLAFAF